MIYNKLRLACLTAAIGLTLSACGAQTIVKNGASAPTVHTRYTPEALSQKVDALVAQMTLDEKISLLHANGKFTVAGIERLGIPEMWLSDGPHGVRQEIERHSWNTAGWDNDHATYLPTLTAVAASWDPEMAKLHGNVLGAEARHRNKDIILGPGVNLSRLPLYGRNFEYLGEDPFLASELVVPEIHAIQAHDVAACVKHYALNTQELNRNGNNAQPNDRTLREVYLPAFEAAVKEGGALTLMGAYNEYYGTNANQSKKLVRDILKDEWGFDGILLTDWSVDINTYDAAVNGLDLEMGTNAAYNEYFLADPLKNMVVNGQVPISVVDEKVKRMLGVQLRIGMLDPKNRKPGARNTKEHQTSARIIAENGVVLLANKRLKNKTRILPFEAKALKKVLVMGPNATAKHAGGGGSSQVKTPYEITPLEGLKNALGKDVEITYLRAGDKNKIVPIEPDYILTRNWGSGTPTWDFSTFETEKRIKRLTHEQWEVPERRWAKNAPTEHLAVESQMQPLQSGTHTFQVVANGNVTLKLNGADIIQQTDADGLIEKSVELDASRTYSIRFEYSGAGHFLLGWDAPGIEYSDEKAYIAAAKEADAVIYFGGLSHVEDREARDKKDLKLPGGQDKVIEDLLAANENTAIFILSGSAVELPWFEKAKAILWGWYGGMEGGNAYANVLLGKVNPGGKMPITLPEKLEHSAPIALDDYTAEDSFYKEGVFIGYRWFEKQDIRPTVPFGHGLSYTSFAYQDFDVPKTVKADNSDIQISVVVKNTGDVAGSEVVQLYIGDKDSSVERPLRELKGFKKVFLEPGESKEVAISLTQKDLAFWDINTQDWKVEPGVFNVYVGSSLTDTRQQGQFILQ